MASKRPARGQQEARKVLPEGSLHKEVVDKVFQLWRDALAGRWRGQQEARKRRARGQQDVFCFTGESFIRKDHVRVALLCYGKRALAGCSGG